MEEIKRARAALAAKIFDACKEFERENPGVAISHVCALHEGGDSNKPLREIHIDLAIAA